jgi:hypothetical protein
MHNSTIKIWTQINECKLIQNLKCMELITCPPPPPSGPHRRQHMAQISILWLGWNHQLRIYWFTSDLFRLRIDSGYGWDFDLDFQVFFLDTRGTAAVFVLLYWSTRRDNYHQGLPRVEKEIFEIGVAARDKMFSTLNTNPGPLLIP